MAKYVATGLKNSAWILSIITSEEEEKKKNRTGWANPTYYKIFIIHLKGNIVFKHF